MSLGPRLPGHAAAGPDLCAVNETIKIIGKKWYLIILHELTRGPRGFNELRRNVRGISAKVLSESLQHLESRSLVHRRVHSEAPIRVEYGLTPRGAELDRLFVEMKGWGERWNVCAEAHAASSPASVAYAAPDAQPARDGPGNGHGGNPGRQGPGETRLA